jgi:hypothetical protein
MITEEMLSKLEALTAKEAELLKELVAAADAAAPEAEREVGASHRRDCGRKGALYGPF